MVSKLNVIIEKLLTKENKDLVKHQLVYPLLHDLTSEIRPYLFFLLGLYVSLFIPIMIITFFVIKKLLVNNITNND